MLDSLRRWFGGTAGTDPLPARPFVVGTDTCVHAGGATFDLALHADVREGLPHPDWRAFRIWIAERPEPLRARAWADGERAWLEWLGAALGGTYRVYASGDSLLLTSQPPKLAATTLSYVDLAQRRVRRLLEELARPTGDRERVIVFADQDAYYRYVGWYYPDEGEFAMSAGMHLDAGCGHFVTHNADLHAMEPVIVHETTHSCVRHLPLPAWLNEGMAVNAEQRLTGMGGSDGWKLQELQQRHRRWWTPALIQEFWSGRSYLRTDDGNELSYDLGRVLVDGLSHDWDGFKRFAAAAHAGDAGAAAARTHLHVDLGEFVRGFLDGDPAAAWGPDPSRWVQAPERGGFHA